MAKLASLKPLVQPLDLRCAAPLASSLDFGDARRGSRQSRGYGADWHRLRKIVIERDRGLCQQHERDGRFVAGTHVDHVVEKADGGSDDPANLQLLCRPCHEAKTAAEQARRRRGGVPDVDPAAVGAGRTDLGRRGGAPGGGGVVLPGEIGGDRRPPHAQVFFGGGEISDEAS